MVVVLLTYVAVDAYSPLPRSNPRKINTSPETTQVANGEFGKSKKPRVMHFIHKFKQPVGAIVSAWPPAPPYYAQAGLRGITLTRSPRWPDRISTQWLGRAASCHVQQSSPSGSHSQPRPSCAHGRHRAGPDRREAQPEYCMLLCSMITASTGAVILNRRHLRRLHRARSPTAARACRCSSWTFFERGLITWGCSWTFFERGLITWG